MERCDHVGDSNWEEREDSGGRVDEEERGTRGGKDVVELSGILAPSTLTGGTAAFARPGGDGGNDLTSLAEALVGAHGAGDGSCKGARNG